MKDNIKINIVMNKYLQSHATRWRSSMCGCVAGVVNNCRQVFIHSEIENFDFSLKIFQKIKVGSAG